MAVPVCFLSLWQTPRPKATWQVNSLFGQLVTSPRKTNTKTQGKNLEVGTEVERSATYWLAFPDGTPIVGWTLLHPLARKYIPHRPAHLTI